MRKKTTSTMRCPHCGASLGMGTVSMPAAPSTQHLFPGAAELGVAVVGQVTAADLVAAFFS